MVHENSKLKTRNSELANEEADFVEGSGPRSVLDAGCGTGRVAIELARRGIKVVGVDIDPGMLETARRNAPHLEWHQGDLATVQFDQLFDVVVMAGNVAIFLERGTEGAVLQNLASYLAPHGSLVAGFHLAMGYLELDEYDRLAEEAGLQLIERYSSWRRDPWLWSSTYAVSVHRLVKRNA